MTRDTSAGVPASPSAKSTRGLLPVLKLISITLSIELAFGAFGSRHLVQAVNASSGSVSDTLLWRNERSGRRVTNQVRVSPEAVFQVPQYRLCLCAFEVPRVFPRR